jgi:hypothetical protein
MASTIKPTQTKSPAAVARLIGTIAIVVGLVFAVAGTATWFTVRSNLAAEQITLSEDAAAFVGNTVDGPIDAWLQANVINMHALEASGGKTYAELDREDPVRVVVMNGSFLRASLFTSVIAFGVAALAVATGIVLALLGAGLRILVGKPEVLKA